MAPGRYKGKTSPVHRFSLTHGREAVPKFDRENTEQFFAAATRRKSKILSASKPIVSTEFQKKQNIKNNDNEKKITSVPKPLTAFIVLPPIRTASSRRSKSVSSSSACIYQKPLPPIIRAPNNSLESSSPLIMSPTLLPSTPLKHQFRHDGPVNQDIFRKAYERALSVARSRLLFHDPYSLIRASATHGVLYSYYDHTPMCIFSHGKSCNHHEDKTNKPDRKSQSNILRKRIFNDVIVERYIR
jgi:hypothetical protein